MVVALAAAGCTFGQAIPGATGSSVASRAMQLPASGRTTQPGSVEARQAAAEGSGVATVSSSLQVSGDYSGSVIISNLPPGPVHLSLADALKFGLKANLGGISADNSTRITRAERIQALSALLPNISANASETVTQVNLAAYGFQFNVPPGLNFSIPSVVGPFHYGQLQGTMSQSIYDPVARRNWKATKESERASVLSARETRELVILAVGGSYLQTLADAARVESQRAQVTNAQAVYDQAVTRKTAGTNSKIDVMRSLVELETQKQRLSSLEADLEKQRIALARVIGLPQDRELMLSESLIFHEFPSPEGSAAIATAEKNRANLQSAEAQVRAAEQALSAARGERLPSVTLNGNYGVLGTDPTSSHGVFAVTGSVNVPIWEGGRTKGDIQQADATLRQRKAELEEERGRVEQEVRNALVELRTASSQVQLAQRNRGYANETLTESRDRFAAGVATTVEVVQAQEQVASAENDYISSLFSFDLARLSFARSHRRSGKQSTGFTQKGSSMTTQETPTTTQPTERPVERPVAKQAETGPRGRRRAFTIFFLVLIVLAIAGSLYWLHARQFESTDDAQVDAHLNPISSRIDGMITRVYVDDNQVVKTGDRLADLDPQDYRVSLDQATAQLAQAQSMVTAQEPNIPITQVEGSTNITTGEAEVANAQAALAAAERDRESAAAKLAESDANNSRAQADLSRYKMLIAKEEVSQQEYDQIAAAAKAQAATVRAYQAALQSAGRTVDQRQAQLAQAQSKLAQYRHNAPRQIAIQQATVKSNRASAQSAAAQVEQAKLKLGYTHIVAPVYGIVMRRSAEVGAHITAGQQLLQIAQIGDLWVTANFKETQLRNIRPGLPAIIHVDALRSDFNATVENIGGSTGAVASVLPPENATGNFVKVVQRIPVRIRFKPNQSGLERLRPGMSVETEIRITD